jgi:iron complex transport system ATP-binding protein
MVMATHDLNLAAAVCDRLVLLREGRVIRQGATRDVLTTESIRALYSVEADVHFHQGAGHLTVVPIRRVS